MSQDPQEDKDKDIQDILSGLDDILQDIVNSRQQAPKMERPAPAPPPAAPAAPTEKIELANREGMIPAVPAKAPGSRAEPEGAMADKGMSSAKVEKKTEEIKQEKKGLPSQSGPLDIQLGPSPAPASPPQPKPALGPAPEGPRSAPPPGSPLPTSIMPANAPKDQVRRIAFIYAPEQKRKCEEFAAFIGNVAEKVSKKPLYIQKVLELEVAADGNPNAVLNQAKSSGAVGVLGVLEGLKDAQIRELESAFENAEFFLRLIPAADVVKRTMAIDLVVDLMLLKAG